MFAVAVVMSGAPAMAQEDVSAAANAYSRAQKAELAGDHEAAAELYELADSLAPAPEALRSALKARRAAGQLAPAATHAERLLRLYASDKRSRELADQVLTEAREKLARYTVRCQPKACNVVVDGRAATSEAAQEHVVYIEAGAHDVVATFPSGASAPQSVTGDAGESESLTFTAPVAPATPAAEPAPAPTSSVDVRMDAPRAEVSDGGLPPWMFITGAAVTAGLGAVTAWSALDVNKAHDDYVGNETQSAYEEGRDKERRTNILIGGTIAAGVATGVIAFFTDWDGKPDAKTSRRARAVHAQAGWLPGGGAVHVQGSF